MQRPFSGWHSVAIEKLALSVKTLGRVGGVRMVGAEPKERSEISAVKAQLPWNYRPEINAKGQLMASDCVSFFLAPRAIANDGLHSLVSYCLSEFIGIITTAPQQRFAASIFETAFRL